MLSINNVTCFFSIALLLGYSLIVLQHHISSVILVFFFANNYIYLKHLENNILFVEELLKNNLYICQELTQINSWSQILFWVYAKTTTFRLGLHGFSSDKNIDILNMPSGI